VAAATRSIVSRAALDQGAFDLQFLGERVVLRVGVVVADQEVEEEGVDEGDDVACGSGGVLTEVLLVEATVRLRRPIAVVALDEEILMPVRQARLGESGSPRAWPGTGRTPRWRSNPLRRESEP